MPNEDVDLESLSLDELVKLANDEAAQPRDEQGRFVASASDSVGEAEPQEAAVDEPDEIVYRRVIDLGDGSGTQVFEGATPEDLIEKLATAQEHATRKIRELTQTKKASEPTLDENEEFVLSQQFLQSPTKAFRELFQRNTGMTIEQFKASQQKTERITRANEEFNAGQEFQRLEPEYFPSAKNATKIDKWLKMSSLEGSVENIQKAYADLSESGLLETAPQNNDAGQTATSRIVKPVETVRRAASGISSRRSTSVAPVTPTEDDLYNMPMDKLEELARRQAQ